MSRFPFDPDCGLDIATTTIRELADLATIRYYGYRIVRHPGGLFYIHEAYYDYREGLLGIAGEPSKACGDSTDALAEVLDLMEDALREPILDYSDLVKNPRNS
jgi:hypothetical protein